MNRSIKLLFVDDDVMFLAAQAAYFGSRGFTVSTAEGTQEALALLEGDPPDIIFLDLMMEHSDSGFTLARRIRRDERLKSVPLVMLSGVASVTGSSFSMEQEELRAWSSLDEFVDKPVSARQLLSIVEKRLGLAQGHGSRR